LPTPADAAPHMREVGRLSAESVTLVPGASFRSALRFPRNYANTPPKRRCRSYFADNWSAAAATGPHPLKTAGNVSSNRPRSPRSKYATTNAKTTVKTCRNQLFAPPKGSPGEPLGALLRGRSGVAKLQLSVSKIKAFCVWYRRRK